MLNIQDKRCVVVGGGPVASRRTRALLEAGAAVTVIAPEMDPNLTALPIERRQRTYQEGDLAGAFLVVIASDNPEVNAAVSHEARRIGVLVNRADAPHEGDFTVPAHAHHGPITLAVHTGGVSATAAATIRRELSDALDPHWQVLIERATAYRSIIQERFADPDERRRRLLKLADPQALAILRDRGEAALDDYYKALTEPDA
jgi:precorrin-2 dehydrogenase/sirohydrochlorin ferrochelatase